MPGTYVQPYLFFGGRCEEALSFYKKAIGAEVEMMMRFSDSPEPMPAGKLQPGFEKKVMHSSFRIGGSAGAVVMASDGCDSNTKFGGFSLSLALPTAAQVDKAYNALAEGGQPFMPPAKTFWSPRYGMVTDKFGVTWMVSVLPEGK